MSELTTSAESITLFWSASQNTRSNYHLIVNLRKCSGHNISRLSLDWRHVTTGSSALVPWSRIVPPNFLRLYEPPSQLRRAIYSHCWPGQAFMRLRRRSPLLLVCHRWATENRRWKTKRKKEENKRMKSYVMPLVYPHQMDNMSFCLSLDSSLYTYREPLNSQRAAYML